MEFGCACTVKLRGATKSYKYPINWSTSHDIIVSNTKIIQTSKLTDDINLNKLTNKINEDQCSSFNSKSDNNIETKNKPAFIHKVINVNTDIKLCDTYIKSKYIRIVKLKRITPINQKFQEIHADL